VEAGDAETVSAYRIADVVDDILRCDKNDLGARFRRRQVANRRLIKGRIRYDGKDDDAMKIWQPGRIAEKKESL
jgi:hypothetical protein